jgi:tetratricopeptide (TPR) repeat protein
MKNFFISYNQADRQWAEWIAWQLEEAKYTTELQAWDFHPGFNFIQKMHEAVEKADTVIAVISPDFFDSKYTTSEWTSAFVQDKLLPVRVIDFRPEGLFGPIAYLDLVGLNEKDAKAALLAGVMGERAKPRIQPIFPGDRSVPLQPSFPGALPAIWNIPFQHNINFTGREQPMGELWAAFTSKQPDEWKQVLWGLGGVGKTQIAIEHAYRHKDCYKVVHWLRSEERSNLASDYADLASDLDLPEKGLNEQKEIVNAVRRWLEKNSDWLLIFDNALDPGDIKDFMPRGGDGRIIITSRNPDWESLAKRIEIKVFKRPESLKFLEERTGQQDGRSAEILANELGDLPLALEQAGAYINSTSISLLDYCELFQSQRKELWKDEEPVIDYQQTIATTWSLSIDRVKEESPEAADLLNLCSFLAPEKIPIDLFSKGADDIPESLTALASDTLAVNRALRSLRRYSLVDVSGKNISVHRLVQAVIRDLLKESNKFWAETALNLVNRAFPFNINDPKTWEETSLLLPHALAVAGHGEKFEVSLKKVARLLNEVSVYKRIRAEFPEAKSAIERAIDIDIKVFGPGHPEVAINLSNLGNVLRDLGDLQGSKKNYERALEIDLKVYGPDHPKVAIRLNNLGDVLQDLGDLQGAKKNYERALEIGLKVYGPDHPQVAIYANNLGGVLQDLGDLQGAKKNYERALEIGLKVYGPDHPNVAIRLNNLGSVLQDLGDLQGAKKNYERALEIFRKFFGENHPSTVTVRNNLALLKNAMK